VRSTPTECRVYASPGWKSIATTRPHGDADRRSAGDVEAAVSRIEREIKAAFPEVTRVFVEAKDRNAPSQTEMPV
jgi:hypothetical protein